MLRKKPAAERVDLAVAAEEGTFLVGELRHVAEVQALADILPGRLLVAPEVAAEVRVVGDGEAVLPRVARGKERRGAGRFVRHGDGAEMKHAGLFDPVEPEVFLREAHIGAAGAIEGEAAVARAVQRDHGDGGVFGGIQDQARRVDADAIQHALEPAADEIVTGLGEKRRLQPHAGCARQHIRRSAARVARDLDGCVCTRDRVNQDLAQCTNIIHKLLSLFQFNN